MSSKKFDPSVKSRRSFSYQEPQGSTTKTLQVRSSKQPLAAWLKIPPTISEQQNKKQQRQQFLNELKSGEIKENSTVTESGEIISISEFAVAPRAAGATASKQQSAFQAAVKRRRSFSLNLPIVGGTSGATSNAASIVPAKTGPALNQFKFKNVALGILQEFVASHEKIQR